MLSSILRPSLEEFALALEREWPRRKVDEDPFGTSVALRLLLDSRPKITRLADELCAVAGLECLGSPDPGVQHLAAVPGYNGITPSYWSVLHNLIGHASLVAAVTDTPFSGDRVVAEATRQLDTLERWARDPSTTFDLVRIVPLQNVTISSAVAFPLPRGVLRPAPHLPQPARIVKLGEGYISISGTMLSSTDAPWEPRPYIPRAAPVLLIETEQASLRVGSDAHESPGAQIFSSAQRTLELAIASIVLTSGKEDHPAPEPTMSLVSHPIVGGFDDQPGWRPQPKIPELILREESREVLDYFATTLHHSPDSSAIAFATRRLCSALLAERREDALVDAVVVWESLFSGSPETGFQVSSSVARTLLAQIGGSRSLLELQQHIKKIYQLRSDIVHGNAERLAKAVKPGTDGWSTLDKHALDAKRYSLLLLRAALHWPRRYREMKPYERSQAAILDSPWPPAESA